MGMHAFHLDNYGDPAMEYNLNNSTNKRSNPIIVDQINIF
jgi:hypothetical protein